MGLPEWVQVALITLIPGLELRASIPTGIVTGMNAWMVVPVAVVVNIALGVVFYQVLRWTIGLLEQIPLFEKFWEGYVVPRQEKARPQIEKWGVYGLALFIGVPLPGSGVYTGALVAQALGVDRKDFALSCLIGVLFAASIIAGLSLMYNQIALNWAVSPDQAVP